MSCSLVVQSQLCSGPSPNLSPCLSSQWSALFEDNGPHLFLPHFTLIFSLLSWCWFMNGVLCVGAGWTVRVLARQLFTKLIKNLKLQHNAVPKFLHFYFFFAKDHKYANQRLQQNIAIAHKHFSTLSDNGEGMLRRLSGVIAAVVCVCVCVLAGSLV